MHGQQIIKKNVKFLSVRALGVEVYLHSFFTSALDGGELLASQPRPLSPRERFPITHKIQELRAQKPVWTFWKTANACRLLTIEPRFLGPPSCSLVTSVTFYAKYFCVL